MTEMKVKESRDISWYGVNGICTDLLELKRLEKCGSFAKVKAHVAYGLIEGDDERREKSWSDFSLNMNVIGT